MEKEKDPILYIDDEPRNLSGFKFVFKKNYHVFTAESAKEGLKILKNNAIKVIITDQRMPGTSGVELLEKTVVEYPDVIRIILTAYANVEDIIRSINTGKIYQYIRKPWDKEELKMVLDNAVKAYNLKVENRKLIKDLQEINANLEKKVGEKTKEVQIKNEELEKHKQHLEELVEERTLDLEVARLKAEESDRLKSAFLANMSHEIRTPMNAIIGFAMLLDKEDFSHEEKNEFVQNIVQNSESLLRLIEDILDMSKIEAGQIKLVNEVCYLNSFLNNLYLRLNQKKSLIDKLDVELILDIPQNNDMVILVDETRLNQVMTNLLENAFKFTDSGHIKFGYRIQENMGNAIVHFYVEDTGIGIPEAELENIFKRFRKGTRGPKEKIYRGTGLGLYISKSIVQLLGGNIWTESTVKKGTTFYFTIPYKEVITDKNILKGEKKEKQSINNFENKTILIAEDEDSNYNFISTVLKNTKATLIRAIDGQETLEMFKKNNQINLVLLDIQMPVMDGYKAARELKAMNRKIPIIAQTAFAMSDQREAILGAGCDDYISKPYKPKELIEIIRRYIN